MADKFFYMSMGFAKGPYTSQQMIEFVKNGTIKAKTKCIKNDETSMSAEQFFGQTWHQIHNELEASRQKQENEKKAELTRQKVAQEKAREEDRQRQLQEQQQQLYLQQSQQVQQQQYQQHKQANKKTIHQSSDISERGGVQWLFPSNLLFNSSKAFNFPKWPGLSVAMRLYIVVGKISYWLGFFSLAVTLALIPIAITTDMLNGFNSYATVAALCSLPLVIIVLLLLNLGLALQYASCELVKVIICIEANTRR